MVSSTRTSRYGRRQARCSLFRITTLAIPTRPVSSRAREQAEGLPGPFLRREVVRLAEVDRVDLLERDEIADVDGVGELDVQPVEVVRLDRHVAALLDLERADDVLRVDVLAGVPSHLVVADRHEVAPVDEVEAKLLRLSGG